VAAVVCCAACSAGDCSQDLKTGHLLGSSPRLQQYAEVIGAVVPALVIAPVLTLLHHSYVIGSGELKAPQATLFASLTQGIFGQGGIPYPLVGIGAGIGAALIAADAWLKARGSRLRLHPMPVAVGLYLPLTLSVPLFLGGLVRWFATRGRREEGPETGDAGILVSSGLIAGESIMGVLLALFVYLEWELQSPWHPAWLLWVSLAAFLGLMLWLARGARRRLD
jgi:putative OPT family oligopeptide transporter